MNPIVPAIAPADKNLPIRVFQQEWIDLLKVLQIRSKKQKGMLFLFVLKLSQMLGSGFDGY